MLQKLLALLVIVSLSVSSFADPVKPNVVSLQRRQQIALGRKKAGVVLLVYAGVSALAYGAFAFVGYYDREHGQKWFGEDGDVWANIAVGWGSSEVGASVVVGASLLGDANRELRALEREAQTAAVISARF